jgi:HEAT repeat protein
MQKKYHYFLPTVFIFSLEFAVAADSSINNQSTLPPSKIDFFDVVSKKPANPSEVAVSVKIIGTLNEQEREIAIRNLGQPIPAEGMGEEYLRLLQSKDLEIRTAAILGCGVLKERRAISRVRSNLNYIPKNDFIAKAIIFKNVLGPNFSINKKFALGLAAAQTLMELRDWDSVPAVLERNVLANWWEDWLPGFGESVLPLLIQKYKVTKEEDVRRMILKTISKIADRKAGEKLRSLLADPDPKIRGSAALALVRGDSKNAEFLARKFLDSFPEDYRATFLTEILLLENSSISEEMLAGIIEKFVQETNSIEGKMRVIVALSPHVTPTRIRLLENFLSNGDDSIRAEAACSLARATGRIYEYSRTNFTRLQERGCKPIQEIKNKK